jgi:hypothetical protein
VLSVESALRLDRNAGAGDGNALVFESVEEDEWERRGTTKEKGSPGICTRADASRQTRRQHNRQNLSSGGIRKRNTGDLRSFVDRTCVEMDRAA